MSEVVKRTSGNHVFAMYKWFLLMSLSLMVIALYDYFLLPFGSDLPIPGELLVFVPPILIGIFLPTIIRLWDKSSDARVIGLNALWCFLAQAIIMVGMIFYSCSLSASNCL